MATAMITFMVMLLYGELTCFKTLDEPSLRVVLHLFK